MNVNIETLTKIHGDKAESVFREIADLGGYGSIGNGPGQISTAYAGGLDVQGVLSEKNTAVSEIAKDTIAKLTGITRVSADNFEGSSSAHKMKPTKTEG